MSLRLQNGSLKTVFVFALSLLSILCCCLTARATAADPEGNYKYFTATVVWNSESVVQNVPVLLRFSEATISGFDRDDVTESGLEIVDEDGNLLPWEIDTWNATGEILVWVLLPNYHNGAKFTVRYGTDFANARPPASDVWAGYVGVWHLNDLDVDASTYGSYSNSTAIAGLDGEKAQASIADQEGKIGKSVKICDATKQGSGYQKGGVFVLDSGANSPVDLGSTFTISGWFKHKNQDYYYDKFFAKRKKANNQETPNGAFAIEVGNNGSADNVSALGGGSTFTKVNFNSTLRNTWSYLTFVYDNSTLTIYQDGAYCNSFTINPATDNNAPLCFGNMTIGYGNGTGDCAWCGWIDEVRLADSIPSADWIAAEYAAMAGEAVVSFSCVSVVDAATPVLAVPALVQNQDGSFTVSVVISKNVPAAESVQCTIGGVDYAMSTEDTELPMTYSATVSNLEPGTYLPTVRAESTTGNAVYVDCSTAFHAGALVVSVVSNADEGSLTPGVFRIARADSDATGLPALTFDVAFSGDGLDAVVAPTASTLTIPADAAYVDISLTPVYTTAVDANKTITVSVSGAFVGQSSDATLTVFNADYDISVRYVATNGDDAYHGGTSDLPKATIGAAVSSLAYVAQSQPCVVYVAPGEYPQTEAIRVEAPIKILGTGESATNVVLQNTTSGQRVITIAHADAELALVTLTRGSANTGAACLGIEAGLVRDCWVTGCTYYVAREDTGGTVFMRGGRLARSVIKGNSATSTSWNETFSAGVYATAGVVENCLIIGNSSSSRNDKSIETSALSMSGTAQAVNCTIIGNSAKRKDSDSTRVPMTTHVKDSAKVVNCVIFGNTCDNPNYIVWAGTAANYINCASEVAINGTCLAIIDPAFADPDNGDYTPVYTSPLRDAGSNSDYTAAATSTTDIKGDTRILHDTIDIGAWENVPVAGLAVDFSYTVNRRLLPASVTFTALPENVSGEVVYKWDFDSDGTIDRETTEATIAAELTVAKVYDVTLTAISGQDTATAIKYQAFSAIQKDIYVATNGTAAYPFATSATASTTIHAAIEAADDGCVIHVLPGTYSQSVPFALDKAVTLVSATTNAADVILRNTASDQRIVEVSDEGAELVGVTLTNGKGSPLGSALTLTAGLVRDCIVTGSSIGGAKGETSGTVWMSGGRLMCCRIVANSGGTGWNADCAPVNAGGGIVESCLVATNRVSYYGDSYTTAQGVKLTGPAKAINCTIANNVCTNPGVDSKGNRAHPMATYAGSNARFINCAIWGNVTEPEDTQNFVWHGTAASYVNCYSELTINETSPAIIDPGFTDVSEKDYSLTKSSPLINKGADYAAAGGISEFDIAGKPRLVGSKVDIGCYECQKAPGFYIFVR